MAKYILEIAGEISQDSQLVPFDMCRPSWWEEAYNKGKAEAESKIIRCKDCKYFEADHMYIIQGLPIMGNLVCMKWGDGCRTDENGFCFLAERRTDE
ncbi:MAG: hypothetical protein J6Y01_05490 [Spirochaetales bacterium]|nr:hypothetical protein [Spirochaetales bacterium]